MNLNILHMIYIFHNNLIYSDLRIICEKSYMKIHIFHMNFISHYCGSYKLRGSNEVLILRPRNLCLQTALA